MGTKIITVVSCASARAERSRPYTSWITVRVSESAAALPAACTARPASSAGADGAIDARRLPRQNRAVPVSITARRPTRSASGP